MAGSTTDAFLTDLAVRKDVVLSRSEVRAVLALMRGVKKLVAAVLYGSGVRLREGLSLRVKDADARRGEILVRDAKGNRDRVTMLPRALALEPFAFQLRAPEIEHGSRSLRPRLSGIGRG